MKSQRFKILKIEDSRKTNANIKIGETYTGEIDNKKTAIWYTDEANVDWVFYVGDTCELIPNFDVFLDNKIDKKKTFTYKELIRNFIDNKEMYSAFLKGIPFERVFINTLSMIGVPNPIVISDYDWSMLYDEFKKQMPNPKFE